MISGHYKGSKGGLTLVIAIEICLFSIIAENTMIMALYMNFYMFLEMFQIFGLLDFFSQLKISFLNWRLASLLYLVMSSAQNTFSVI